LSTTRNKISAHIDRDLSADEMQILLSQADPSRIGLWLHTCVAVLADFIKLPVYFWSCEPDGEGTVRILFKEPFVVTLSVDSSGKPNRIVDVHMIPKPPRSELSKLLRRVVKNSQWMFGVNSPRILNFVEDSPSDTWAKSLQWLPRLSGSPVENARPSIVPRLSATDGPCLIIPANAPFFVKKSVQRITKLEDLKW